jgi:hypothetical protein
MAMLEQAILLEQYDVACEFMKEYKLEILKLKTLKAVDYLMKQMDGDPTKYEAKVYLATLLMPCMSRVQGQELTKILESMVSQSYEKNVFYKNINPIRTGLMVYKLVHDLHYHCDTADGVTTNLKQTVKEKLIGVVQTYKDAEAIIPLFEQTDFEGQNCYYYLSKFELSEILNCPILEQTIEEKWNGRTQVSCSFMDYSTPWTVFKDELKLFSYEKVLTNIKDTIFHKNAEKMTHVG